MSNIRHMYYATAKEMESLDRHAVASGLEIRQMMELAGWHIIALLKRMKIPKNAHIVVVVGKGNNGGGGLSAARHLANHGRKVSVIALSKRMSKDAKHHLALIKKMKIPLTYFSSNEAKAREIIRDADVLIDALLGYHVDGSPRGAYKKVITIMNEAEKKIISYDIPSGIDATSGDCHEPCIRAETTLTVALPKKAFLGKRIRRFSKEILLADIGIPAYVYNTVSRGSRPHFEEARDFIKL